MDAYKYQLGTLCLLLLPLSVAGQEWSKQDSLRLQQTLNSEQEGIRKEDRTKHVISYKTLC